MKRRDFLKKAGVVAAGATLSPLMFANAQRSKMQWSMVTSWPRSLDILFGGAQSIADRVKAATNGDITIQVYEAGAQVGALEVFDAVSSGAFEMGHTASYYYVGKDPAHAFFTTVPFGLTPKQINSWIESGGGQALWDELSGNSNLKPLLAGNTGQQMAGWFNKEINTPADLQGLSFRTAGLGAKVYSSAGVNVQTLGGGEIFLALQRGVLDAAEWVGPHDDEILGLNKAAKYYYSPGWQEPGAAFCLYVNLDTWKGMPSDVQSIVADATQATNIQMLSDYTDKDPAAFKRLVAGGTQPKVFPEPVLKVLYENWVKVNDGLRGSNAMYKKISDSMTPFMAQVRGFDKINQYAYLNFIYNNT